MQITSVKLALKVDDWMEVIQTQNKQIKNNIQVYSELIILTHCRCGQECFWLPAWMWLTLTDLLHIALSTRDN